MYSVDVPNKLKSLATSTLEYKIMVRGTVMIYIMDKVLISHESGLVETAYLIRVQ